MAIKHYLNFVSLGNRFEIDPLQGLDGADFSIDQADTLGRDIIFAGGKNKLTAYALPNHCFKELLFCLDKFGKEAVVNYEIEFSEDVKVMGAVDFLSSETDRLTYFTFTIIEVGERAIVKSRYETQTNILGNKDVDGNAIDPCITKDVFLKAYPIINTSQWSNPIIGQSITIQPTVGVVYLNPVSASIKYDIENSLSWLEQFSDDTGDGFRHIEAKTNLLNVTIRVKHNIDLQYTNVSGGGSKLGLLRLRVVWGQTNIDNGILAGQFIDLYYNNNITGSLTKTNFFPDELVATIPFVNNTDFIWLNYTLFSENYEQKITFNEATTTITATSVAYDTVVPMVRLIDAMRFVVRSISGLQIVAPRFDIGGQYYDQYITTTQLMRRLYDKPFNVSLKEIVEGWLPECNGGFVIKSDSTVFFGYEQDFYNNVQIASFEEQTVEGFEQTFNPKYNYINFNYKYKLFQASKEVQEGNTNSTLHAETELVNGNRRDTDTRTVDIDWGRDPLIIENARRKAYDLSDSTATQDDDKIFVIDVVPLAEEDRTRTQTALLQHLYGEGVLTLRNNNQFSWIQLGIGQGSLFQILSGQNAGGFVVLSVTDNVLQLGTGVPKANILGENTTFLYQVYFTTQLTNRTDEGFIQINNVAGGDNFANLRFTPKRNILNFWQSNLATAAKYSLPKPYRFTVYKNNPEAETRLDSEEVLLVEGADFVPVNPILEPILCNCVVAISLYDFIQLQKDTRDLNGFVRIYQPDGLPLMGWAQKATWTFDSDNEAIEDLIGRCEMTLEVKAEPFYMTISGTGDGLILINNEEFGASSFTYEIDAYEKLLIFDGTGKLLYSPVPYDRVRVNNSDKAQNVTELRLWLNNLKPE